MISFFFFLIFKFQDLAGFLSCSITGKRNLKTFAADNRIITEQCEHILAKSCDDQDPDMFEIRSAKVMEVKID